MSNFQARIKNHMSYYKVRHLDVHEQGTWNHNGQSYSHILPLSDLQLNILETIREPFWAFQPASRIRLHKDFHHLNSSQAMCFNLFFPFFGLPESDAAPLLQALGLPRERVADWRFEWVRDERDGTNFDFWILFGSGKELFFEVKFSESAFGTCERDDEHRLKREEIYRPRLIQKVKVDALDDEFFFSNYQALRNVAAIDIDKGHSVVFLYPEENRALIKGEERLRSVLLPPAAPLVRSLHLGTVVAQLKSECQNRTPLLKKHLALFEQKYLPNAVASSIA